MSLGNQLLGRAILLVDDHDDTRAMLDEYLTAHGAVVTPARNGAEGRRLLPPHVDLIVVDIAMPGEDGLAMMEQLRRGATHGRVPAIAITGLPPGELEDRHPALFHAVFRKPFALGDLVDVAASVLDPRSTSGT